MAIIENTVTTTDTNDKTVNVPASLSNVVIIAIGCPYDSDGAHTNLDTSATFDGNTMTLEQNSHISGQAPGVQIYSLKNYTSNGNKTMHWGYHGGVAGFRGCIYVLSGSHITTNPDVSNKASNSGSANPTTSLVTTQANDIILEGVAGSNTLTLNNGQTNDVAATGVNGGNINIAHKSVTTATTYNEDWTMSSGTWAIAACAIRPVVVAFIARPPFEVLQAVNRSYSY